MSYRPLIGASVLTVASLAAVAALAYARSPVGATAPIHWNAAGEADRFADAGVALFTPVALAAVLSLVMAAVPRLEPMQDELEGSAPLLKAGWIGLLALAALIEAVVAGPVLGFALPSTAILFGLGLLLVLIGDALPKSRPGFFVGIRTPWTLTDPDNWIATHRYASGFFVAAGLVIAVVAITPLEAETRGSLVTAALLVAVVTPVLYSYFRWRTTR